MSDFESTIETDPRRIQSRLAEPFKPSVVKWLPRNVKGNRAMALAYVSAHSIMQRLDEVVGLEGWEVSYQVLADNAVTCTLRVRIGDRWIEKTDVGVPSEQPDAGDRLKASFSDGLKRVAVHFGIARYLRGLPQVWCDYDPTKRQFTSFPELPPWALPKSQSSSASQQKTPSAPVKQPVSSNGSSDNLESLYERALWLEKKFIEQGKSKPNELMNQLAEAGRENGFPADLRAWTLKECGAIFSTVCDLYEIQCKSRGKVKPVAECKAKLKNNDAVFAENGRCEPGEFSSAVVKLLKDNGFNPDKDWSDAAIEIVNKFTESWKASHPATVMNENPDPRD